MQKPPISLRGVRQNNLKNIDIDIPSGALTVITGVSGSGKSSLAFDTLYAEGSRRYMESLSTYARQFLEKMPRPEVETIHNVPPALALEQRNSITNNRTTVATMTEVYDYLRLFFSALGLQKCKACGHPEVEMNDAENICKKILALPKGSKIYLLAPLSQSPTEKEKTKPANKKAKTAPSSGLIGQELYKKGFQRLLVKNEIIDLATAEGQIFYPEQDPVYLLVDRMIVNEGMESSRLQDSVEQSLLHGGGRIQVQSPEGKIFLQASHGYSCLSCGEPHIPPTPTLFSSNSPLGACETCSGFGEILEYDEELVIPDRNRTLRDGAVDPLSKPSYKEWEKDMLKAMEKRGVAPNTRYKDITTENKKFLWDGGDGFPGIRGYFALLSPQKYKLHVRVFTRRYQNLRICPSCQGSRLSNAPLRFTVGKGKNEKNIADILGLTIDECVEWFSQISLGARDTKKVSEVLRQLRERFQFLQDVGVGYLRLNRKGNSLSGGEFQRICLASQLGSKLSNTLYVLDEPSIGLHPSDTDRLIKVIHTLRDHGNTLVVVEHDPAVMRSADYLVEIGPQAGSEGGKLIALGATKDFLKNRQSLTARYLNGELSLQMPSNRRKPGEMKIELSGCTENNLKNVDLSLPLGLLVAVTGVSGSGKSTLIHDTLYKLLARYVLKENVPSFEIGKHKSLLGWDQLGNVLLLDQRPIGRSSRSNSATYMKMYDEIRRLMANQAISARKNLSPTDFSFNVDGGRCPACQGDGFVEVDMHFMADVRVICDACEGKRFKKHVLEVQYRGKNIDEILHTTIKDARSLFADVSSLVDKCQLLEEVGLGYLQLGQAVSSLSGGECQRLKIAATLDQEKSIKRSEPTLYIFDEPTTGLHMHDVRKLAEVMHNLVEKGHTVLFIEHNLDLVSQADWVIDVGPQGGDAGGRIVAQGSPEQIAKNKESLTGKYLRDYFV